MDAGYLKTLRYLESVTSGDKKLEAMLELSKQERVEKEGSDPLNETIYHSFIGGETFDGYESTDQKYCGGSAADIASKGGFDLV